MSLAVVDWGVIDYQAAADQQLALVDRVQSGQSPETVVICSHPPVVTLGRSTLPSDLVDWSGAVVSSSRGGRATYHGPNQVVIYPILDLRREDRINLRSRDIQGYVRLLLATGQRAVAQFGVKSEIRQGVEADADGHRRQLSGLWVNGRKIASVGVAVRKWITYHGIAVNLTRDNSAFRGIRPCGFSPGTMAAVEEFTTAPISRQDFVLAFIQALNAQLGSGAKLTSYDPSRSQTASLPPT